MVSAAPLLAVALLTAGPPPGPAPPGPASAGSASSETASPHFTSADAGVGRALLVGCTEYEADDWPDLRGPVNDVPLLAERLREGFGFPAENIIQLAGWPADPAARPTAANIAAAFERLIAETGPGNRVVVLLAGHGTRLPIPASQIDPLDPRNPEPDGMDEAFLPADFRPLADGADDGGALRDDEIGRYLDRLKARGAHVWALFDCCHSGTMMRSGGEPNAVERPREVPALAAASPAALRAAAEKVARIAAARPEQSRGGSAPDADGLAAQSAVDAPAVAAGSAAGRRGGSVVAFYAAQSYETAPETRIPFDAADVPENYYGVFSHTLCAALREGRATSYRSLGRRMLALYQADRPSRGPTPFFVGDLDRPVLDAGRSAEPPALRLTRRGGVWRVTGGMLASLRRGTILAVRPEGAAGDAPPLGYVEVTSAEPTESEVAPVAYGDLPALPITDLPDGGRCDVALRDLGETRVSVALLPAESPGAKAAAAAAADGLDALEPTRAALLRRVLPDAGGTREEPPSWRLHPVAPADAAALYGLTLAGPAVLLVHDAPQAAVAPTAGQAKPTVFARYDVASADDGAASFARRFADDLLRIYTWENTWRVAADLDAGGDPLVQLEVADPASPDEPLPPGLLVAVGRVLQVRLRNADNRDRQVVLLNLTPDCGIQLWGGGAVKRGDYLPPLGSKPLRFRVTGEVPGPEAVLVLSSPVAANREPLDLSYLEQDGFGGRDLDRSGEAQRGGGEPLERLLRAVALGRGMRSSLISDIDRPESVAWTWTTAVAPPTPPPAE